MTPEQVAQLRAELRQATRLMAPALLARAPASSLIQAASRALGWDLAALLTGDPLADVPDAAVATMATLLQRRLTELGAGATVPSADERAAALAAFLSPAG